VTDFLLAVLGVGFIGALGYMKWQMINALEHGDLMDDAMRANAERAQQRYREHGTFLERRAARRIGTRAALNRAEQTKTARRFR
jgi:hypothetical protein